MPLWSIDAAASRFTYAAARAATGSGDILNINGISRVLIALEHPKPFKGVSEKRALVRILRSEAIAQEPLEELLIRNLAVFADYCNEEKQHVLIDFEELDPATRADEDPSR